MDEKYIVKDVLENYKSMIKSYQDFIVNTENTSLRQVFQEIRNSCEVYQFELFRIARLNKYYVSPPDVTTTEISNVNQEFQ